MVVSPSLSFNGTIIGCLTIFSSDLSMAGARQIFFPRNVKLPSYGHLCECKTVRAQSCQGAVKLPE